MLQTLITCEMLQLAAIERADLSEDSFWEIAGNYAAEREAEAARLSVEPGRWVAELVSLLNIEDDYAYALASASRRRGNPPIEHELILAMQATAALIRGHLAAAAE